MSGSGGFGSDGGGGRGGGTGGDDVNGDDGDAHVRYIGVRSGVMMMKK